MRTSLCWVWHAIVFPVKLWPSGMYFGGGGAPSVRIVFYCFIWLNNDALLCHFNLDCFWFGLQLRAPNCDTMKVAVVFVLLFAAVLCRPVSRLVFIFNHNESLANELFAFTFLPLSQCAFTRLSVCKYENIFWTIGLILVKCSKVAGWLCLSLWVAADVDFTSCYPQPTWVVGCCMNSFEIRWSTLQKCVYINKRCLAAVRILYHIASVVSSRYNFTEFSFNGKTLQVQYINKKH